MMRFLLAVCVASVFSVHATSIEQHVLVGFAELTTSDTSGDLEKQDLLPEPKHYPYHDQRQPSKWRRSLTDMIEGLEVMQQEYFEVWTGQWPRAIDWTSAVLSTHLSACMSTISAALEYRVTVEHPISSKAMAHENFINRYFSQLVSFYFGQDAFALRQQAYDDMLWVVLGWLEGINFVESHAARHYSEIEGSDSWYGKQWIPSFAHRARVFWDLASQGWDMKLCSGGMLWSPYTVPYKNAITNELFITASISMYLHFPGDNNSSPFMGVNGAEGLPPAEAHSPIYLARAVEAYKWLKESNMTDHRGLYADGYHISGWERHPRNGTYKNTRCDVRNDMTYTYNQGVLLSGQRGLYIATGMRGYLDDGHRLVRAVINATGFDLRTGRVYHGLEYSMGRTNTSRPFLPQWQGVGRGGVLEEQCDAGAFCSQDAQTFKGIFFHHLTTFCGSLSQRQISRSERNIANAKAGDEMITKWHDTQCAKYAPWIEHNANFARRVRNNEGKFGMWWGAAGLGSRPGRNGDAALEVMERLSELEIDQQRTNAKDYRNAAARQDGQTWRSHLDDRAHERASAQSSELISKLQLHTSHLAEVQRSEPEQSEEDDNYAGKLDLNDRRRGRTVETQSGGVALMRSLWEVVERHGRSGSDS